VVVYNFLKPGVILLSKKLTKINEKYRDAVDFCKILSSEFHMRPRQELIDEFNNLARTFKQLSQDYEELCLKEGLDLHSLSLVCQKLAIRTRLVSLAVMSINRELPAEALAELNVVLTEAYAYKTNSY